MRRASTLLFTSSARQIAETPVALALLNSGLRYEHAHRVSHRQLSGGWQSVSRLNSTTTRCGDVFARGPVGVSARPGLI